MNNISKAVLLLTAQNKSNIEAGLVEEVNASLDGKPQLLKVAKIEGQLKVVVNVGTSSMLDYKFMLVIPSGLLSISEQNYKKEGFNANGVMHYVKHLSSQNGEKETLAQQIENGTSRKIEYQELSNADTLKVIESLGLKLAVKISDNCKGYAPSKTIEIVQVVDLPY